MRAGALYGRRQAEILRALRPPRPPPPKDGMRTEKTARRGQIGAEKARNIKALEVRFMGS